MSDKMVLLLAEGFEEAEAVNTIDFLRRVGIEIAVVGLTGKTVTGSHGIALGTDMTLKDVQGVPAGVILPGGMPGSNHLRDSREVLDLVRKTHAAGRWVCAICAAPIVLEAAGVIAGKTVTSYPGFKDALKSARHTGKRVERDGNTITASGPGSAFAFAFAIAVAMGRENEARQVAKAMLLDL